MMHHQSYLQHLVNQYYPDYLVDRVGLMDLVYLGYLDYLVDRVDLVGL